MSGLLTFGFGSLVFTCPFMVPWIRIDTVIDPQSASELILFQTKDGKTRLEARFTGETAWLSLNQMAELFQRDKSVVSKHIRNIFEEGELRTEATVANCATVQIEAQHQPGNMEIALEAALQKVKRLKESRAKPTNLARSRGSTMGFTRVELVGVIFLVMLLASVLLPSFQHYRARAQPYTCLNNLKQIGIAYRTFAEDNKSDDSFPAQLDIAKGGWKDFLTLPNQEPACLRNYAVLADALAQFTQRGSEPQRQACASTKFHEQQNG